MPAAKFKLSLPAQKNRFRQLANQLPLVWSQQPEQYCDYRIDAKTSTGWLRVKQYTNGTLYLEASTDTLLEMLLELLPEQLTGHKKSDVKQGAGVSAKVNTIDSITVKKGKLLLKTDGSLDIRGLYIGTDESGKGDYFGPLVTAGVLVDDDATRVLQKAGIMDSKKLTAQQIERHYHTIVDRLGENAIAVSVLEPLQYNALYTAFKADGKNLNHLLAWGHSQVIEELLEKCSACEQVIIDKFAHERFLLSQLLERGKAVKVYQTPRAEINAAVAAASIVARYHFTTAIQDLSEAFQVSLPLGAGAHIKGVAREVLRDGGPTRLENVAKLHFKTTLEL